MMAPFQGDAPPGTPGKTSDNDPLQDIHLPPLSGSPEIPFTKMEDMLQDFFDYSPSCGFSDTSCRAGTNR